MYPRENTLNFDKYSEKIEGGNYLINKSSHFLVNIDVLGWFSYHPGHSCKHIRDSGSSRGDGEYWIDPEKNGNPLKVYCDMTNAEGKRWTIF